MMKNYPWKEFICLALTPLIILFIGGLSFLVLNFQNSSSLPEIIQIIGILAVIIGATSLIFIPAYILFSFLIPFSFNFIKHPILRFCLIAVFNVIFFYIVSKIIDNGTSWDLSKLVMINTIFSAAVYTIAYAIIRLAASKIKREKPETESTTN
jgi:hypothetical protein